MVGWWTLMLACGGVDSTDPPPVLADDSDPGDDTPDVVDSDSAPPELPPDTETSDPPGPPLAPPAPSSWGEGFVDETALLPPSDVLPITLGSYMPAQPPESGFGAIGDIDEDGHPELLVGNGRDEVQDETLYLRVYTWWGPGDLRRNLALEARVGPDSERPWMLVDLDEDGHLDLLQASVTPVIRWGAGDGSFPEQTALRMDVGNDVRVPFQSGGALYDIDQDGWLDLLIGLTGCSYTVVPWLRTGPRSFEQRDDLVTETTGPARTTALLPLVDTHGAQKWVAVADSCDRSSPHPGFYRVDRADRFAQPHATAVDLSPVDAYWRFDPITGGGPMTLVAPMGAATTDWDLDGELDVAVSLGTVSFALLAGQPDGAWADRSPLARIFADPTTPGFINELAWGIGVPDLDMDGFPDLLIAMGDDATSLTLVRGRTMQPQVWRNLGAWAFVDITADVGLDVDGGWHGLVLHDLEGDGDADILLGGYGVPPRLLHNRVETDNHGLTLRLRGTTSNRFGYGAIVRVRPEGLPERTLMMGESGNLEGQSEPVLFLGLGTTAVLPELEITWPSGLVQRVTGLAAGQVHEIEEWPTVEVLDDDHHLPAGGTVDLRVTPRLPDGAVDHTAGIEVIPSAGGLRSAQQQADGSWLVRLVGPAAAGSSLVEVRIDGVAVQVWPRLWWDG